LTEIFDKNRYNGQVGNCNVSVGRYKHIKENTDIENDYYDDDKTCKKTLKK